MTNLVINKLKQTVLFQSIVFVECGNCLTHLKRALKWPLLIITIVNFYLLLHFLQNYNISPDKDPSFHNGMGGQKRLNIIFNTNIFTGKGDISIWAKTEIGAGPKQQPNQQPNTNSQIPTSAQCTNMYLWVTTVQIILHNRSVGKQKNFEASLPPVQACEILDR